MFLIEISRFQVEENCWGEQEEKETGEEKDGLRLHCPFTKWVRYTQFCEGKFLDNDTQSLPFATVSLQ